MTKKNVNNLDLPIEDIQPNRMHRLQQRVIIASIRAGRGLPVRGQCTQSNARTRKGPRKTVAGKKGVKENR